MWNKESAPPHRAKLKDVDAQDPLKGWAVQWSDTHPCFAASTPKGLAKTLSLPEVGFVSPNVRTLEIIQIVHWLHQHPAKPVGTFCPLPPTGRQQLLWQFHTFLRVCRCDPKSHDKLTLKRHKIALKITGQCVGMGAVQAKFRWLFLFF